MILSGRRGADPYKLKPKYSQQPKQKIYAYPLFLLQNQVQKKKLSKRKRRNKLSRSAERDKSYACPRLGDADTHASHMCQSPDCASL